MDAKKPLFFEEGSMLREVDECTRSLKLGIFTGSLQQGRVYSGGQLSTALKTITLMLSVFKALLMLSASTLEYMVNRFSTSVTTYLEMSSRLKRSKLGGECPVFPLDPVR